MGGSSHGMSSEPPSKILEEMSGAFKACPSLCIRGCAPRECTIMLPKKVGIGILFDKEEDCDFLKVIDSTKNGKGVELSIDNFLRTISEGVQVEKVSIYCYSRNEYETLMAVCKSLETVSSLTNLWIWDLDSFDLSIEDAEAIFKVLGVHNTLEQCRVDFVEDEPTQAAIVKVLVDSLLLNPNPPEFSIFFTGHGGSTKEVQESNGVVSELDRYMKSSTNVRIDYLLTRSLGGNELSQVADLLHDNQQVRVMGLWDILGECSEGLVKMGEALQHNCGIEVLYMGGCSMGGKEMKPWVQALIPDAKTGIQPNTHLNEIHLQRVVIKDKEGDKEVIRLWSTLLQSNTSLTSLMLEELNIYQEDNENVDENLDNLFKSLQSNASLEMLSLDGTGFRGNHVLGMIMDMLLHNHTLKGICFLNCGLESDGGEEVVNAELRTRGAVDTKLQQVIRHLEHVPPNFARVFLCGDPEAGKTTLCNRWSEIANKQADSIIKKKRSTFSKLFHRSAMKKREKVIARQKSTSHSDISERTRGIEVHKFVWEGTHISLWDMAGQLEYHAFHDLVLPNQSAKGEGCFYFVVCDPSKYNWNGNRGKPSSKLEGDIEYWLMFLASNTRHSASYRPHVTILMTHHDNWQSEDIFCNLLLKEIVSKLKSKYGQVLDFDQDLDFINMDNKKSSNDADMVKGRAEQYLKQLCFKLPKVLKASLELQSSVSDWCSKNGNAHILKWEDFSRDLFAQVEGLKPWKDKDDECLEKLKKHTTKTLHGGGHIMFFEDIDLVIMNPHWFCNKVIGNILFECSKLSKTWTCVENGIVSQDRFVQLCKVVSSFGLDKDHHEDTLNIMKKLQICYEDQDDKIMIPSLLTDAQDSLDWSVAFHLSTQSYNFVGTKLRSKYDTMTLPSEGFFPRIQVLLHDKYGTSSYKVYMNVISFIYKHINVFIVRKDGAINIMSQAPISRDGDHAHYELHKKIIKYINDLRQKPTLGCPGVIFEEHSIWPRCVEHPFNGKLQSVSKKHLKDVVLRTGDVEYAYQWVDEKNCAEAIPARKLLGDEEWRKLLDSRARMVEGMVKVLDQQLPTSSGGEKDLVDSTRSDDKVGACGSEPQQPVLAKLESLKRMMQCNHKEVMEKLSIMETKIIDSQKALAARVCSHIDDLMKYSVLLKDSKIPKLPYIVECNGSKKRRFLLKVVPGLREYIVKFRCEHNDYGFHTIEDQPGCEILVGTENTRKFGTVMFWGLVTTTWLLKMGAHLAAPGMGNMVPNLAEGLATILDTPGLLDMAQPKGRILECLPEEFKTNSTISLEDNEQAKEWLIKLLEPKGQSIYDMFKLTRVAYASKSSKKQEIGWVCDEHKP